MRIGDPLQSARRLAELRQPAVRPGKMWPERAQVILDPRRRFHLRPRIGQTLLLAHLDPERSNFVDRKVEPLAVTVSIVERLALVGQLRRKRAPPRPRLAHRAKVDPPERIE